MNQRVYIGASKNPDIRFSAHMLCSDNINLRKDVELYGKENFTWSIVEECNRSVANEQELYWIQYFARFHNIYNLSMKHGYSTTEHTERVLSEKNSGENNPMYGRSLTSFNKGKSPSLKTREKLRQAHTGRQHSEETRQLKQIQNSGENNPMYGRKHSEESKRKNSIANTGENNPMYGKQQSEEWVSKRTVNAKEKAKSYWNSLTEEQKAEHRRKTKEGLQKRQQS